MEPPGYSGSQGVGTVQAANACPSRKELTVTPIQVPDPTNKTYCVNDNAISRGLPSDEFGVLQGGKPFGVAVADLHFLGADPAEHGHHAGELGAEGVADFAWARETRGPPRNR